MLVVTIIFLLGFMVLLFRPYVKLLHEVRVCGGGGGLGSGLQRLDAPGDGWGGADSRGTLAAAAPPARPPQSRILVASPRTHQNPTP
jgi:hypothetical protein